MKKLLTIAMALLLLYAGCAQLASTPEGIPHDISAEPSPTANETEAPASGEPQQAHADALDEPDKTDAPAAPKAEVSDVVRYWLLKNYQEAAEVNDDVAGSITQFANYAGMKYKQSYDDYAKWNCMVLMNSEDHDHYAQYIYTGKWAKYGSIQIIGGALSADKKNIDGQIMVFGKKWGLSRCWTIRNLRRIFPSASTWEGKSQPGTFLPLQLWKLKTGSTLPRRTRDTFRPKPMSCSKLSRPWTILSARHIMNS